MIIFFAGYIAEKRYKKENNLKFHYKKGSTSDFHKAIDFLTRITVSVGQSEAYSKYLFICSEDAVNVRWKEIKNLANELYKKKRMTYQEAREVILKLI